MQVATTNPNDSEHGHDHARGKKSSAWFCSGVLTGAALILVLADNLGFAQESGRTELTATELRILDENGRTAMLLSGRTLTGNPGSRGITMYDHHGNERLSLGLDTHGFCLEYEPPQSEASFRIRSSVDGGIGLYLAKPDSGSQMGFEVRSDGELSIEGFERMQSTWKPLDK